MAVGLRPVQSAGGDTQAGLRGFPVQRLPLWMQAHECLDAPLLVPPSTELQTRDNVGLTGCKTAAITCVAETVCGLDGRTGRWSDASPQAVAGIGDVCGSASQSAR